MTTELPPAGWYPDPDGKVGQRYWNGQQWHTDVAAPLPPTAGPPAPAGYFAGPPAPAGYSASASGPRPDTATSLLGLWSLGMGIGAILLDFFCGIGIVLGLIGFAVGFIALNRSKQTNANRGFVIGGLVANGVALAIGLALILFFGVAFTGGLTSSQ
jgi:hypothetical protein